jgi:hypothetical protein
MAGLLYPLIKLLSLLAKKCNDYIFKENDYRPTDPIDSIPKPLPSDFILLAIKAFIESGKSTKEVKNMLHGLNVPDEKIDFVVDRAQKVYTAWYDKHQKANSSVKSETIIELSQRSDDISTSSVIMHLKPKEQYADFFRALMGKEIYRIKSTDELIFLMASYTAFLPPVKFNSQAQICQSSFYGFGGKDNNVQLRVININGQRKNFFPYLATQTSMRFMTNEIFEWESNGFNAEAEVKGKRDDKTELSFFATDYAVNKEKYLNHAEINICISAFAFHIYELKAPKNTLSSNIIIPDLNSSEKHSLYNFTGFVLRLKAAPISPKFTGWILTIKLFENGDGQIPTTIDVFVNTENITSGKMRKNIIVKGTLWLQGEIAD